MGKRRRAQKKIVTKKKQVVAKVFKCPVCSVENSVEAKLNFKENIGKLECKNCKKSYLTKINYLSEPIDLFSEWLDEIDRAEKAAQSSSYADDNDDDGAMKSRKRDRSGRPRRDDDEESDGGRGGYDDE